MDDQLFQQLMISARQMVDISNGTMPPSRVRTYKDFEVEQEYREKEAEEAYFEATEKMGWGHEQPLNVVTFNEETQDGQLWCVAICLENDIVAQAKTLQDVMKEFVRVLSGYKALSRELKRDLIAEKTPAPKIYHDMLKEATHLGERVMSSFNINWYWYDSVSAL